MNSQVLDLHFNDTEDFSFNEAIKTLRTNLQFSGSRVKKILITSVAPNDGKSIITMMLARAFAETGKKTIVIDADVRKSVLLNRYGVAGETVGLTQVLSGQVRPEESVYKTTIPNLDLVLSGPYSPTPTELFEDVMCANFFHYLSEQGYDMVIIDTPPLGTVIDAAILARYSDGIALVAASEDTSKRALQRVKEQIDRTGVRFLGVILNKVRMDKGSYYSSYYHGYGTYGYGYGYGYEHGNGSGEEEGSENHGKPGRWVKVKMPKR